MTRNRTVHLFRWMVREEWRLHSRLFGGQRFAVFPLAILVMVAGGVWLLVETGTEIGTVVTGLHLLAFVFGLNTGSIGFVGRDAIANLLGEVTLLVFASRTLPLSRKQILGLFVAKDVAYYATLFLLPMAAGTIPAASATGFRPSGSILGSAPGTVLLLWVTLVGMFLLGIGSTLAILGLVGRGNAGRAVLIGVVLAAGALWIAGFEIVAYTPYGVFQRPSLTRLGGSALVVCGIVVTGIAAFDASPRSSTRTARPAFSRWDGRFGDPLTTKTVLDVHRSSGGFGKVLFSGAILFGVTAGLVDLASTITGVAPSVGVSFGAILGLTAFTTYNWLTQFDDVSAYLALPVDVPAVFEAKRRAFLLLGPLVGLAFYGIAVWWQGTPFLEGVVGVLVLVGVASYCFGVTIYLTGLSPNEFLFDTVLFVAFGAAVALPLVPILVIGFALAPLSVEVSLLLGGFGLSLGVIGLVLYRRSVPKWTTHHREGSDPTA